MGEASSSPIELGVRRRADADLSRRSAAAQFHRAVEGQPSSPVLVGQAAELRIIRALLADVAHGGGALVMSGDPGIAKSGLLDAADCAASAMGMRVLRASGTEFEADIDMAGLHQLLVPLSIEIGDLPHRAGRVLEAALGVRPGRNADRLVVLNAVFALLRHAAARTPLLLMVDEVHWFDRASVETLAFVARRIAGSRIGLLAAMRVGSDSLLERVGLPELRLRPFSEEAPVIDRRRSATPVPGKVRPAHGRTTRAVRPRTSASEPERRSLHIVEEAMQPDETYASAGSCSEVAMRLGSAPRSVPVRHTDPELRTATDEGASLFNSDGDVTAAHRLLVSAISRSWGRPDLDIPGLVEALHLLSVVCDFGGRPELWVPFHRALDLLGDAVPPVLQLIAQTQADPAATSTAVLLEVDHQVNCLRDGDPDPAQTVHVGMAAQVVDRLAGCRDALRRVFLGPRDEGSNNWAVRAGLLLAIDAVDAGRWAEAEALADECIALSEAGGQRLWAWPGRHALALIAAGRGDWDRCRALTKEMVEWATPRGVLRLVNDAHHTRCLVSLGHAEYDDAFLAGAMNQPNATETADLPILRGGFDLVEAAVRTGRYAAARTQAAALTTAGVSGLSPRLALQAAGADALVAPDELGARLFQAALEIPGIEPWPFDVARIQLALGERLRRQQATRASRKHLAAALDAFTRLGARPWAERARTELGATGQTRHRSPGEGAARLTPQERGIAELAATGLTNKEIGGKMYLSPRTVSAHLYRIFPKLGITSRAALRDALGELPSAKATPM